MITKYPFMRILTALLLTAMFAAMSLVAQPLVTTLSMKNGERHVSVNADVARSLTNGGTEITLRDFPVNASELGTVVLHRRRAAVDATTQWIVPTPTGDKKVAGLDVVLYSGDVANAAGSKVWLAYTASTKQMLGIVQYADGKSFVLGPSVEFGAQQSEHVFASSSAIQLPRQASFACAAPDMPGEKFARSSKDLTPSVLAEKKLLQVDIAVETDVEFFKATGGSVDKARSYTAALYSVISAIYEDEVHVIIHLPWVKTWTDNPADPYNAKGDWIPLRDKALDNWENSYKSVKRDVYQVITSSSFGSGGYGYYDALCGKNGKYGMSVASVQGNNALPTFAFSYDVYIVAHELGHNFNADHTHSCNWNPPIDTCIVDEDPQHVCFSLTQQPKPNPGSILSYCAGVNAQNGLGFQVRMTLLPKVAAVMRATAEAAACLTSPGESTVTLISPHGEEVFASATRTNIRWRATEDVLRVKLEYSRNGGATWKLIEDQVDATLETYSWLIPAECSNRMLVRIVSTFDPSVADVSLRPFQVEGGEDPDGLVAWYPMDGNSDDYAPCGLYPANGNATLATDKFSLPNRAYAFDGTNNLVAPDFNADFEHFTVSLWFKVSDKTGVQQLVGQDWSGGASTFMLYSWEGTLGGALYIQGNGIPFQVWGPPLTPNQWYHAVYSYDGSKTSMYVDGFRGVYADQTGTLAKVRAPLYIGSRGVADRMRGSVDDIRIYNRALSQAEVTALFTERTTTPVAPTLVAPANNAVDLPSAVRFQWAPMNGVINYQLQVNTAIDFGAATSVYSDTTSATERTVTNLAPSTKHYWRVAASNGLGKGAWSTPRVFTTVLVSDVEEQVVNTPDVYVSAVTDASLCKATISTERSGPIELSLFDVLGKCVSYVNAGYHDAGTYSFVLDVDHLTSGAYYLAVKCSNEQVTPLRVTVTR